MKTHRSTFSVAAVTLLIATTSALSIGCDGESAPLVTFVLPEDYRGIFVIVEDPAGARVTSNTLRVPENGVLRVRDVSLLEGWHKPSAEFQGGKRLPIRGFDSSSGEVELRSLGTVNNLKAYFVGSRHEAEKLTGETKIREVKRFLAASGETVEGPSVEFPQSE